MADRAWCHERTDASPGSRAAAASSLGDRPAAVEPDRHLTTPPSSRAQNAVLVRIRQHPPCPWWPLVAGHAPHDAGPIGRAAPMGWPPPSERKATRRRWWAREARRQPGACPSRLARGCCSAARRCCGTALPSCRWRTRGLQRRSANGCALCEQLAKQVHLRSAPGRITVRSTLGGDPRRPSAVGEGDVNRLRAVSGSIPQRTPARPVACARTLRPSLSLLSSSAPLSRATSGRRDPELAGLHRARPGLTPFHVERTKIRKVT